MYIPPAFREDDTAAVRRAIREARLSTLVTATSDGLLATPLPLLLDESEGGIGTLHGHLARANTQWTLPVIGEAMVIFSGPDAYVTPSWYASKREHGKVVPTWNYVAVHAYGEAEFFDDESRLHDVVSRLTDHYERPRREPWAVSDAPQAFVRAQLKGIVGLRLRISRVDAKKKMSQNRSTTDRAGVAAGLRSSEKQTERDVAKLVSNDRGDPSGV